MSAVRLDRIVKRFGATEAVRGVSLDIADGEFVVFVGPSGCGKTTTLNIIAGLESPTSGDVYIGNAAQTLHPVAGQGLNLGLRDAWDLAQLLRDAPDPGDAATLARFAARRRLDAGAAIRVTDLLATALLRSNPLTGAALTALDVFPAARRFFARRMIFGASALP